ncbi:hypothetical protein CONPUDRAFT_62272, partial [Coniophora puteana RWD-64-598 SS2]
LFNLRTGHAYLNHHASRLNPTISPACSSCGADRETVHHFLVACPTYRPQRERLRREVKAYRELSITELLGDPEQTRPLLRYIHATARFAQTFGNLEPPPSPETPACRGT